jgi:uncharacterized protein (DUF1330 family)
MKSRTTIALALVAAFGLGGAVVEGLHAQAKSKAIYVVAEIDVSNLDAYTKEFAPKAQALIKSSGAQLLAAGQNVKSYEGAPPAKRVAIQRWDSMDHYMKYRNSAQFKENRKVGDKYAKFRAYSVEALN